MAKQLYRFVGWQTDPQNGHRTIHDIQELALDLLHNQKRVASVLHDMLIREDVDSVQIAKVEHLPWHIWIGNANAAAKRAADETAIKNPALDHFIAALLERLKGKS